MPSQQGNQISPKILTEANDEGGALERYWPEDRDAEKWELAISGYWSQGLCHSGHVGYYVRQLPDGSWIMRSDQRNTELDGLTEEDIEEGCVNDDQLQAMWGMTLAEAQSQLLQKIVAVCPEPSIELSAKDAAALLYQAIRDAGGMIVEEADDDGLLVASE